MAESKKKKELKEENKAVVEPPIEDEEDKKKPLSDQAIADALDAQGIKVARRTVAKYREEELKILPARLRKAL